MEEKPKTYRINGNLSKIASEIMIRYITEEQEPVTEAQVINAAIEKGLKEIKNEEIKLFVNK